MIWMQGWRDRVWANLQQPWDVIVIGGGITGAGILREASRHGLRALLVEQSDFASGTSSRSSKLVHGGLRYLSQGNWRLTRDAVRERDRLLKEGPGLVDALDFVLPVYAGQRPGRTVLRAALVLYDLLAGTKRAHRLPLDDLSSLVPDLKRDGLKAALCYMDALTDDARLVLRVIQEAVADGASALPYTKVTELVYREGRVGGVKLHDRLDGSETEASADLVINATGAWAPAFMGRSDGEEPTGLRALRGSHLVFPHARLPMSRAVTFFHPEDRRPVFAYPWEGRIIVGTTDIDHAPEMSEEPRMSGAERDYLLHGANARFPGTDLQAGDAIACYSGVRSVVNTGAARPSDESRDHAFWLQPGLLTVTGGKLTTFRLTALEALEKGRSYLPRLPRLSRNQPVLTRIQPAAESELVLGTGVLRRLYGRYGRHAGELLATARDGELEPVGSTPYLWAELRWAARAEAVVHLQDLLSRRTRIALVATGGGEELLPRIREIVQEELGWDDARWEREEKDYLDFWSRYHNPASPA